jgi:uncharacterized membrane protein
MSDWNFIAAAYASTWIVIVGYAFYLSARRRAVRRAAAELRELEMPYGGDS